MKDIRFQSPNSRKEIDLVELFKKIWAERKFILRWCGIAAVIGLVVAFSIPKEYTTRVTLAPESTSSNRSLSGLSALAGMAGINLGGTGQSRDALFPTLYPNIVSSIPFVTELFDVPVKSLDGKLQTTVFDYMTEHQRAPWWRTVLSFPMKAVGWFVSLFKEEKVDNPQQKVNPFQLTRKEAGVVAGLSRKIDVSVDKKTYLVTLSVTMQDPLISATLTDTVLSRLQNYITKYRTDKSRQDLAYVQKLYDEAKQVYYDAQQQYADYVDQNQNIMLRSVQVKQERLQNEMNLAYNLYNQTAQQLQMAKAKVQENTPVYAVVQTATVPLKASRPSKMMILIGFVLLAGIGALGWSLFIKDFFDKKRE